MVIYELMLKEGVLFPLLYFDGTKKKLKEVIKDSIKSGQMITFTSVSEGRSREVDIIGSSILSYETDIDSEAILGVDLSDKENNVVLFPTAGHEPITNEEKSIFI